MKHLVTAFIVLVGTATSVCAGPADMFTEKVKDFGTTPRGSVQVHYFRFTNNTKQTLSLGTPRVSCGCTSASVSKNQVAPGETAAVVAFMDTRRIPTPNVTKSVLVYVPFLSPTHEEVTLRVQTVARDDLMMSPDTIAFGNVKSGEGARMTTKVTFMSDPNWKITEALSTGGFVKTEIKEESRNGSMVTYEVSAILEKACPAGNWISDINLKTSNPAVASLRIPVTVNVTSSAVAITPETATFGNLPMGIEMEKTITLKSGKPFKILEVKGADEQLKVTVDKVGSKEVHTVVLAANPKVMGGFTRMVEIVTDDKDQPKLIIPVTARVVAK